MKSEHRRFVLFENFSALAVETKEKRNRFEQTSRTLQRKISMRSTKDQLVKKDVLMPVKNNVFLWNLPDVEEVPSHDGETSSVLKEQNFDMLNLLYICRIVLVCLALYVSDSPLVSMEVPLRTAYGQNGRYGMQPKARQSSRAGAAKTQRNF
ncbi:hypothetical protein TNCV_4715851 [Trichonephila clavipes]|nr:hypothetical protein TNCV_4715851 [Trichonephila clavipes]